MADLRKFKNSFLTPALGVVALVSFGALGLAADETPAPDTAQQTLTSLIAPPSPGSHAVAGGPGDEAPLAEETPFAAAASDCVARLDAHLAPLYLPFDRGATQLRADLAPLLSHIAALVAACEDAQLMIAGHADADGDDQTNLALSWDRADETLNLLVGLGVDPAALEAVGYGARVPVAQGSDDDAAANRRVEFRVLRRRD